MEEPVAEDRVDAVDRLIGRLYRAALGVPPDGYRLWALRQLQELIPFDAALWGSGTASRLRFHTCTLLGLDEDFPAALEATGATNPMAPEILRQLGRPVDMAKVLDDERFYASPLYRQTFAPRGIQRILATAFVDRRSGLYSLISLYRRDRGRRFSAVDCEHQSRLMFHLLNAASHAFFLHMTRSHAERPAESVAAAIDREGIFHEAMPRFMELLDQHFPERQPHVLPFEAPAEGQTAVVGALCVRTEALADLRCIYLWPAGPLDRLTSRERAVVYQIAHGLTFKQAARRIGIAPSTVANHLYRIYRKLGVYSRSELAGLVYPEMHRPAPGQAPGAPPGGGAEP